MVCWGPEPHSTGHGGWDEPPEGRFVALDAAGYYTCAVDEAGEPECWGAWSDVVLEGMYPGRPGRLTTISVAGTHGCGLWKNGTPFCWGHIPLHHPISQRFSDISVGGEHICAIRKNNAAIVCWGDDEHGQASPPGGERFIGPEIYPEELSSPSAPFISISSGEEHACGLDEDRAIHCWGNNDYFRASPPLGEGFLEVNAGAKHTCALRKDRSVVCWGVDDHGQASPPEGKDFVSLSSGGEITCALRACLQSLQD